MLGREGAQRVPGDLRVVMAVIVDKAGRDGAALGVDRAPRRTAQLTDVDDPAVLDADIAPERGHPRAVDNKTIPDQQIIPHRFFLSTVWVASRSSFLQCGSLLATRRSSSRSLRPLGADTTPEQSLQAQEPCS